MSPDSDSNDSLIELDNEGFEAPKSVFRVSVDLAGAVSEIDTCLKLARETAALVDWDLEASYYMHDSVKEAPSNLDLPDSHPEARGSVHVLIAAERPMDAAFMAIGLINSDRITHVHTERM